MARLSACLKRQVVAMDEGVTCGKPADFLLDLNSHRISAVVLGKAAAAQLYTVIPADAVQSFGQETLPVRHMGDVSLAYMRPDLLTLVENDRHMRGRDVLSNQGQVLGSVVDVEVGENGEVVEYRIRRGLLDLITRRTHSVLPGDIRTSGAQVAVAEAKMPEGLIEQEDAEPASETDKPAP